MSSGTTGIATVGAYTDHDLEIWGDCFARGVLYANGGDDDIMHVCYGYGLFTGGLGAHYGGVAAGCMTIPMSAGNTERQIRVLREMGSTILCCTPSYAMHIADTAISMGLDPAKDFHLRAGIHGAEAFSDNFRAELERKFDYKVLDVYGLTETMGPGVAIECWEQTGLHLAEDHFLAEIIDPDTGEVLPEGSKGELVFTAITKQAFPLLRYRTKDICVLDRTPCSCGRTHVRMSKPMGRSDDMMIIRGVNVFPSQIESVLLAQGYSANYQIVVDRANNRDSLDVNVELAPEMFSDTVREITQRERSLEGALKSMLGIAAKVHLMPPKSIQRSEGKAVRVIDKRKLVD